MNDQQVRFDELIHIAKSNERKQENFQQYELALLCASDLKELLTIILEQHKVRFQLSEVTLLLYDPEYEVQRLLTNMGELPDSFKRLFFTDSLQQLTQYYHLQYRPRLRQFSAPLHQFLFPKQQLGSVALLPLIRQNTLIGSLNLGSRNITRFQPDIATQFLQHLAAVVSACLENACLHEQIKLVSLHDALTGVNNRLFFDQRLQEEVDRSHRTGRPLSCLFLDLDHFKKINDIHGHQAGDAVLRQTAQIFASRLRSSDILARYGGEEFVILLTDTTARHAYKIAEQIRQQIYQADYPLPDDQTIQITVSIGLATLSKNTDIRQADQLVRAADEAVYAAKTAGRNQVRQTKQD